MDQITSAPPYQQQQQRLLQQHQQQQQLYNFSQQQQLSPITPIGSTNNYFSEGHSPTHTSPPTSANAASTNWRTSDSRDDLHSRSQQQQYFPPQPPLAVKQEPMSDKGAAGPSSQSAARGSEDPMPSTSDFVKKLYKMLEDPAFQSVVCWGPQGDCFVVKDMNEFTKSILPRMFKHSNFASFVRQLNKYDFHKVKNTDDNQFGEHSWTFRHPDFHADRKDALENIRRKVPAARKTQQATSNLPYPPRRSSSPPSIHSTPLHGRPNGYSHDPQNVAHLQNEIQRLKEEGDDLRGRIRSLERNYESVLVEMVGFQRGMAQQDGLMQNLIAYFLGSESGKLRNLQNGGSSSRTPLLPGPSAGSSDGALAIVPPSSSSPGFSPSASTASAAVSQHFHAQLQQQQNQHEQAQAALQARLNNVVRERERNDSIDAAAAATSSAPTGSPPIDPMSYADSNNPFLPAHALQRMLNTSNAPGVGQRPPLGGSGDDVGRATLMQMSELSRRAAMMTGGGSTPNLWNGMNFTAGDDREGEQPSSRADALNQIRTLHRERVSQGGWANAPVPPRQPDVGVSSMRRSMSEERRGSFGPAMSSDEDRGQPIGISRSHQRRRQSETGTASSMTSDRLTEDELASTVDSEDNYASFTQQQTSAPPGSASRSQDTGKARDAAPSANPWASLMSGQAFPVDPQSSQTGFPVSGIPSFNFGTLDDDGSLAHEGLQVYTVGHLLPRGMGVGGGDDTWSPGGPSGRYGVPVSGSSSQPSHSDYPANDNAEEEEIVQPTPSNSLITPGAAAALGTPASNSTAAASSSSGAQKLRVRRATYVPGWAVPPRVLLVDDDAVSRKLSSKFLKVFGCTIDVAVDGIGAVNKMNLEKYDLVLMDIVMPKLDGVSATNLIRKFDQGTPIISMTSNSKPNEIMTYYSSGMNDVLPKPFTKEGLLDMLEKHLMHLKVIQQMAKLPRSVGMPPLSDTNFEQAFTMTASNFLTMQSSPPTPSTSGPIAGPSTGGASGSHNAPMSSPFNFGFSGTDDGRINPLAGMGLTDEQYTLILQNIVNGDGFMSVMDGVQNGGEKRPLDDPSEDGRDGKRSRFEVVE